MVPAQPSTQKGLGMRSDRSRRMVATVSFSSLADITALMRHVRFAPNSGHRIDIVRRLLCATRIAC